MRETQPRGLFVTGVGTGVGKTYISRALAHYFKVREKRVAAIKPIETGVETAPLDALALAKACGHAELANAPGLYRVAAPLAPLAATMAGSPPPPPVAELADTVRALGREADRVIIEGAGGLLVPIDDQSSVADLARALGYPLVLVADNRLGVLSSVLTCCESARARALEVAAVVLVERDPELQRDPSTASNQTILAARLPTPVLLFPHCRDDNGVLAAAAHSCGLTAALR